MGIREDQEAQAAKFISVRNILIGLSDLESVSVSEVASYLLRKMELAEEEKPQFIRQDRESLTYFSAANKLNTLLRSVAASNDFYVDFDDPNGREYDVYGWFRGEIKEFLSGLNQEFPACLSLGWTPAPKQPDWLKPYEHRVRFSAYEAVCLLANIDPCRSESNSIKEREDIRRWSGSVFDAIDSQCWGFRESHWGMDRDEQTIEHTGIKDWARDTGAPWPFLADTPAPTPESAEGRAIVNELEAAKNRIIELENEIQAMRQSSCFLPAEDEAQGVTVRLPYLSPALDSIFKIMACNWANYDPKRVPKQVNIAREIDEVFGWGASGDPDEEPSRNAKVIAMLIKPDKVSDPE